MDIDIEEVLKEYNENQVLADLECFKYKPQRKPYTFKRFLSLFESWHISYNIQDYFKDNYDSTMYFILNISFRNAL